MDESQYEMLGSRSYLYINVADALLYQQIEITTQRQTQQQIILLKVVNNQYVIIPEFFL